MTPISSLTARETAGQRLMVGFNGLELTNELKFLIQELRVGGIILFARNIAPAEYQPGQLAHLCRSAQEAAAAKGLPPLFIAVDQEGGVVARLRAPFTAFPGNPSMQGIEDARQFARITATELTGVGFNMNMAPVMDVAPAEIPSIMASRAFGGDPDHVARMGCAVIREMQRRGVMAVAKHFPGIGRTTADSHAVQPVMPAEAADLERFDLPPFHAAIRASVAGIMLSHIRYSKLDSRWPASLSPAIARDLLRTRMGFRGLTLTDDLDMGAIAGHIEIETAIRQCLAAEIDMALICHWGPDIQTAADTLIRSLENDAVMQEAHAASLHRILHLKQAYCSGI